MVRNRAEGARTGIMKHPAVMKAPVRWTARLKRKVLLDIDAGCLTEARALRFYGISAEELAEWRQRFAVHGSAGLMATRRAP